MKVFEVLTIILLLLSGSTYILLSLNHPSLDIGIVLIEGMDEEVGVSIRDGFSEYDDFLDPKILEYRFNDSDVRIKGGFKLISDHFRTIPLDQLRSEYNVDIILIVTNGMVQDWDSEEGKGYWGKADPAYDAALITTYYWQLPTSHNRTIWAHLAIHETMHLLGYIHNPWDRSGVMQYAKNTDRADLVPYYEFQLPVRTSLYSIVSGTSFRFTVFIMNLAVAMMMFPMAMSQELIVSRAHVQLSGARLPKWLGLLSITGCFFLFFAVTGSFVVLIFTLMFSILVHMTYQLLIEKKNET
jgi:hypothetical protein